MLIVLLNIFSFMIVIVNISRILPIDVYRFICISSRLLLWAYNTELMKVMAFHVFFMKIILAFFFSLPNVKTIL